MVEKRVGEGVIRLVRGDITLQDVDAFVFDTTADLKLGSGYGGAIATRGGKTIQQELNALGSCPTGEAIVTGAGNLKARYIIHANGPKFFEPDTASKLRATVHAALRRAEEKGLATVAFPPIGSGLYQVPTELCAQVMVDAIGEYLKDGGRVRDVAIVAMDQREFSPFEKRLAEGN